MTLVYQSTRDENNKVTASQAILQGLATDGGLFTPLSTPEVALDFDQLKDASYQEVAKLVLSAFLDDFTWHRSVCHEWKFCKKWFTRWF